VSGVDAVGAQLRKQREAFWRARFNAEAAAFALAGVDQNVAAIWSWHAHPRKTMVSLDGSWRSDGDHI